MIRIKSLAYFYLGALLVLTLIPLGPLNATLNDNYTLHIRWDYLLHAMVYLPLPFFVATLLGRDEVGEGTSGVIHQKQWVWMILLAGVIVVAFEGIQKFLPYRSFNINDMLANGIGAILGLLVFLLFRRSLQKLVHR